MRVKPKRSLETTEDNEETRENYSLVKARGYPPSRVKLFRLIWTLRISLLG